MKRSRIVSGSLASLLVWGGAPGVVEAVDLTGTWVGKITCDGFDTQGKFKSSLTDDIMLITQVGADLNMVADDFDFFYDGKVIDDPVKPASKGQATFIECGTAPPNVETAEIGRAKVRLKVSGDGGRFTARSILSSPEPLFQSCRWSYKRLDSTDPGVPDCDALPLVRAGEVAGHGRD